MCTAISYKTKDHYFGRNLDLEYSYNETVTVTPRKYSFDFREMPSVGSHYAIIGMAYVQEGYPLYYDGTNENGLSMAGLSFPDYAHYSEKQNHADNIAPFELIPWVLCQCRNVMEAKMLFSSINIISESYSEELHLTPLHWMISDSENSIVVESAKNGLRIFDNPVGVLTNSPAFDYHMTNLNNYMSLSNREPKDSFTKDNALTAYSRGMGAIGLPGDYSSASRFVKAAFVLSNSVCGNGEEESVSQFFHILGSVAHPRGSVDLGDGKQEITVYSSCCNTDKGIYYYTTYNNSSINAVDMHREDLDSAELISYPLLPCRVHFQN